LARSQIVITQAPHGSSAPGIAKRSLDLYVTDSESVWFTNSTDGNIGVTRWEWVLIERPPGSTVSLLGADSATAELRPDVYGRYVVSLRINGMGSDTPGYMKTVASVSFPSLGVAPGGDNLGDWDLPAFHEGTSANWEDFYGPANPYGAQRELYRILHQLRSSYVPLIGHQYPSLPFNLSGALVQRSDSASWADAGYLRAIDFGDYTFDHLTFGAVVLREGSAGTAYVRIYDETHTVAVTGGSVSTIAGPVEIWTADLPVGAAAGNMRNDASTLYKVQVCIVGGSLTTDFVNVYDAFITMLKD